MYTTLTDYFSSLYSLMETMVVTDQDGKILPLDQGGDRVVQDLLRVKSGGKKVMLAGNGGSAAIASHVQNDLFKRVGIKAIVFTEQPLLSALANDEGYETIFEWPIRQWGDHGDLMIAVSSSGRSANILRGADAAINKGCGLITFTGFHPENPLRGKGHINFYVDSNSYGHVETTHAAATHFITDRAMILEYPESEVPA